MEDGESCNTGLGLGIGMGEFRPKRKHEQRKRVVCFDLSFPPLNPNEEAIDAECEIERSSSRIVGGDHLQGAKESNFNLNVNYNESNKNCTRKKLRLTTEQSTLLEESFKLHTTLDTAQKQALAEKLNLRPRQVEVWFQNRRARTKLKQKEVDCELLKKGCKSLSLENVRLKKELQELLRSLKLQQPHPFYIQLPMATTRTMCPSCEKL
ncbi:unnamed protein product [Ilex paraguariensis]|uniref:Homeobox domain-containing protein n=1 Tax=Ilex paraguariensis TaxID=185542 RepID=A0ABC8V116_9AQUA